MFEHIEPRVATGLKMGRPDNRRYTYKGDRRSIVAEPELLGPDAHGVAWWPIRCYYDEASDTTLVVFEPVHPEQIAERLAAAI